MEIKMAEHGFHIPGSDGKGAILIYVTTGLSWAGVGLERWFGFMQVHFPFFDLLRDIAPVFTFLASCCAIYTFIKNMVKKK
jgi:hypothetical protein